MRTMELHKQHSVLPIFALWQREIIRFFRQKTRVVGVLLTPLVFWLILGLGFGESFSAGSGSLELSYLEFFYPGIIVLILLFTSIFSNISLIEDRNEGFFQNVLIAPVTSHGIVSGKIFGGATIALIQASILLIFSPFIGFGLSWYSPILFIFACLLISIGLSSLGFLIAWKINSIQGFHAIMNVVLVPLWLLSGAVFPAEGSPAFIKWIIAINPVGYGVDLIRSILYISISGNDITAISRVSIIVTIVFSFILFFAAVLSVRKFRDG